VRAELAVDRRRGRGRDVAEQIAERARAAQRVAEHARNASGAPSSDWSAETGRHSRSRSESTNSSPPVGAGRGM
jgi:hypothetical protein